jgi:hypothetical protein
MGISRTPMIDDDGTGTTGTVINNSWKQELYDQIDAAIATGGVSLPISVPNGGTGQTSLAASNLLLGNGIAAVTPLPPPGSSGLVLTSVGGASPIWQTNSAAPRVVVLTDAASVPINPADGNVFRLAAGGDRTIALSAGVDGQSLIVAFTASSAARTLTLSGARFGSDIPALTQTVSGKTDYLTLIYNSAAAAWDVIAYRKGY